MRRRRARRHEAGWPVRELVPQKGAPHDVEAKVGGDEALLGYDGEHLLVESRPRVAGKQRRLHLNVLRGRREARHVCALDAQPGVVRAMNLRLD